MRLAKFDRDQVKPGDMLHLADFQRVELRFKSMARNGDIVASFVYRSPEDPKYVILHQRDVLRVIE